MKRILVLGILLTGGFFAKAQETAVRIAENACKCIESVRTIEPDSLQAQINQCISSASASVILNGPDEERKKYTTVQGIQSLLQSSMEVLFEQCPNYRNAVINIKTVEYYTLSKDENANKAYLKGNTYAEVKEYGAAIKEYLKAIAIDSLFIFALDNTAICYRKTSDYSNAEKYYKKSLQVFPQGDVALLNIAGICLFKKQNEKALEYFKQLRFYHPHNAEGYFGIAKVSFEAQEYEEALDNAFRAYRIYSENKSPYVEDGKKLIAIIYNTLKEKNKLDLFNQKAKQYNISFEGSN
ncbi:Tetratricopeptide repeat protein [compost metagenome]